VIIINAHEKHLKAFYDKTMAKVAPEIKPEDYQIVVGTRKPQLNQDFLRSIEIQIIEEQIRQRMAAAAGLTPEQLTATPQGYSIGSFILRNEETKKYIPIVSGQQWVNHVFGRWGEILNDLQCLSCAYFQLNDTMKIPCFFCTLRTDLIWSYKEGFVKIVEKCGLKECSDEAMSWAWAQLAEVMDRNDRLQKEQQ